MRLLGILLALVGLSAASLAQTNDPTVRRLSLEDCITIALQHNLDVQIKRYNPQIARFALGVDNAYYEPKFFADGAHDYNLQPGGVDAQGRPYLGQESDNNRISTALSGSLPWGLSYALGGNMRDTYGTRPATVEGPGTTLVTNTFVDITMTNTIAFITTNSVAFQTRQPFENVSGSVGFLTLRQSLLKDFWIDSTRLQIILDKKNIQVSEQDLRSQIMVTVTDVEKAYYELIYNQQNIEVQRKALELAERTLAENRKRVEVGAMAPLDEKQAESQAATSRADLLAAMQTEGTQQRVLKVLLSDDYSKWKDVIIQPTITLVALPERFSLQESWRNGLSLRPDLQQQKLALEKQGYVIRYQKNQLFPKLDLVGNYAYNASASTLTEALDQYRGRENPFWSVGGEFSIPLGNGAARNNYRAAKATKEQIELQLKRLEQIVLISIENDIASAMSYYQKVQATREARIYAEAALDAEQKKLESGKSTSFEVLRLQRDLTDARSKEIRALADYNDALAQLALDEGTTLERRHVTLQVK